MPTEPRVIGLNCLFLVPGETGGIETYARRLIPALAEARPDLDLVAFLGQEAEEGLGPDPFGGSVRLVGTGSRVASRYRRVLVEQRRLPELLRREGVQLLHSLGTTTPARPGCASVATIHDVIYATHPEAHTRLMALGMRFLVPLAARSVDRVIAPSNATAHAIVEHLRVPRDRIDVVYSAGGLPPGPATPESDLRARYELGDARIVLSVSARRPHKNLLRLLEAFGRLNAADAILVLPGYTTPFEGELRDAIERLRLGDRVRTLGWVPNEDLEGLYTAAACFVFPSLVEGFGQPVLEAMERGLAVACSSTSSLPEVGGDAVLYFDPLDVGAIRNAIDAVLTDRPLARRLAEAGRRRAGEFSWERTARETAAVYERAYLRRG